MALSSKVTKTLESSHCAMSASYIRLTYNHPIYEDKPSIGLVDLSLEAEHYLNIM
jgi:hypothetical protein